MSSLATSLVTYLHATSGITSLIGTRTYPNYNRIADKTYPLLVYKVQDVTTLQPYTGPVDALQSCQIALHCIGATYGDADTLATAIQSVFDGFKGTWGTQTIQGCFLNEDGIQDDVATEEVTEEIIFHIKVVTFTVWYVNQ